MISACGNTQRPRQGPPHLRLETISARNGPCPASRKPPHESSVPGEKLTRGSRRNQLRRGHGSPPVLSEVFSSLALRCALQRVQTVPAAIHSGRIPPSTTNLPRGRKTQPAPLTTPDMVRSGRVLHTSVKSHFDLWIYSSFNPAFLFPESHPEPSRPCTRQCR